MVEGRVVVLARRDRESLVVRAAEQRVAAAVVVEKSIFVMVM